MRLGGSLPILSLAVLAGCVAMIDSPPPDPRPAVDDGGAAAVEACLAAIAVQTGHPRDKVKLSVSRRQAADVQVFAMVPGGEAPWRCQASPAGSIKDVMYTGSEGAL